MVLPMEQVHLQVPIGYRSPLRWESDNYHRNDQSVQMSLDRFDLVEDSTHLAATAL
jgi:hypothetical protein